MSSTAGMTADPDGAAKPAGFSTYLAFIEAEAASQDARKASLEARGMGVITSAGTVVSLLFGLIAAITGATDYSLPPSTHLWLFLSAATFLVAFLLGVGTNFPFPYQAPRVADLEIIRQEHWTTSTDAAAAKAVAGVRLSMLKSAKRWNGWKARFLMGAFLAEFAAIAFLGRAVWLVIDHA